MTSAVCLDDPSAIVSRMKRKAQKSYRENREAKLQKACVQLLKLHERQGRLRFFAVMNEGKRSPKRQGWAKAMGLCSGVPDLVILVPPLEAQPGIKSPKSDPRTIFVELKAGRNTLTESQSEWAEWLKDSGFTWALIRDVNELALLVNAFVGWGRKAA